MNTLDPHAISASRVLEKLPTESLPDTAPHTLQVDSADPDLPCLGHHQSMPALSWKLTEHCSSQTSYEIAAASNLKKLSTEPDLWESGWVTSDQSIYVLWGAAPLSSRQRVFWRVRIQDQDGATSAWSEPAVFEIGLLQAEDWQAQWIASPSFEAGELRPSPYLRRGFEFDKPVASARLHVTALGLYQVYLNGKHVTAEEAMCPGWTDYNQRLHALTYDVTENVTAGQNVVGAILGDGWYYGLGKQISLIQESDLGIYGHTPELLLQLEITHDDGSITAISSDHLWKAHHGPIRSSSIYDGEIYDVRHELPGWSETEYDDSEWTSVTICAPHPYVRIEPKPMGAVKCIEELQALTITEPLPGKYVFDLGQNMVGWVRIQVPAQKDQEITLRFAEMLQDDGTLYTVNYRRARSSNHIIPAVDGELIWTPTFTFHGFRYVELSGLPDGVKPDLGFVTGIVLHTEMKETGRFVSSHEKLNRLQKNIIWGQKGNFLEVPTDCPQRDERLGWTGDAQVFCATSCFNFDTHAFWRKWLVDLADAQREDGALPHVAPDVMNLVRKKRGEVMKDHSAAGWADAGVIVPWEVYVRYGDQRLLKEFYPMMTRWVDYCSRNAQHFILKQAIFGDWLQPNSKSFNPENPMRSLNGDTPEELISTAYLAHVAGITSSTASLLEIEGDNKHYSALRKHVQEAFVARFFDGEGRLKTPIPTQTGYLMALGYDLLPESMRAAAARHLVDLVHEAGDHLRTGFLGTSLLCPVLDRFGYTDLAYKVMMKETYPSWFYSINQGATTMWERWNSYSKEDGFGDPIMNSFNHYAYGAIGQWMYERVAGLSPDPENPGYKHFFVKPAPGGGLTSAEAALETPHGTASVRWQIKGSIFDLEVKVPPNTTATAYLPDDDKRAYHLKSGVSRLVCQLP